MSEARIDLTRDAQLDLAVERRAALEDVRERGDAAVRFADRSPCSPLVLREGESVPGDDAVTREAAPGTPDGGAHAANEDAGARPAPPTSATALESEPSA
jgi:hypothetical protein